MDDLDVFVGLGTRGTGKSNPMRPDRRSVNDSTGFDYDSIFRSNEKTSYEGNSFNRNSTANNNGGGNDLPVYDKPVYDDDIFDGVPGLKSNKSNASPSNDVRFGSEFDDLLGNLSKNDTGFGDKMTTSAKGFDDLFTGLGSGSSGVNANRPIPESRWGSVPSAGSKHESTVDDPFVVLESNSTSGSRYGVTDPLDEISKHSKSKSVKVEDSFGSSAAFNDLDPLNSIGKPGKSTNSLSPPRDNIMKDVSPPKSTTSQSASIREPKGNSSRHSENKMKENVPVDIFQEPPLFDAPDVSSEFPKSFGQKASPPPHRETGMQADTSPTSKPANPFDDIWLTVSEIPLFTQTTSAPPPSRLPPPVPHRTSRSEYSSSSREKSYEFSSPPNPSQDYKSPKIGRPEVKGPPVSQFDELEEFAMGKSQNSYDGSAHTHSSMDGDATSAAAASAAAMKDAMDKAEAKFRHAKELREREHAKTARSKESVLLEKDDEARKERELREAHERIERERQQKEEEEREQKRREREREREIERERSRQAVERATREARERAAAEARMRAERSAVEKANAEARERAERAAVQRAQAEARERAAAEARERAEKAAAEAREREMAATVARERAAAAEAREKEMREKAATAKAEAEARRRAERAAVERAAAEARERAAAEAREWAATAAKMNQQRDDDLESFFNMGRASSAPRARTSATDPFFDTRFQNKAGSDAAKASSSSGTSSNMRKASSTTNFVDDLSSIFGAATPSGEFQEVDGESEERRRARLERHQRTQERAAKALAEKNQRDLQAQREQEERHRIAETLDIEIKRWAAGKEGNLRALLSTMQYVLWAECGWQPVSLMDLITGASVKKVYRKATLCIHPDKVQQKGATLQQKYIAEKVFDLLKEAWNKFNSEELF